MALQGCGTIKRWQEATNDQCSDGTDNDRDMLIDCVDPDCQATSVCARLALWADGPESGMPRDAQVTAMDSSQPPTLDATTPPNGSDGSEPWPPSDGAMPPLDDATTPYDAALPPQDPCQSIICEGTSTCVDGGCTPPEPPVVTISMKIRITSAVVPSLSPTSGIPFDTLPTASKPDPYVVILVNSIEVFRTSTVMNNVTPSWNEPGVRLDITSTDQVEFQAMDNDSDVPGNLYPDNFMYSCIPNLPSTQPTELIDVQCLPTSNILFGSVINGTVEPAL